VTGSQKLFDIEDERKVRIFYDKRMSQEVDMSSLGDEWKVRYVFTFLINFNLILV
jgi:small subunit ribosomal protein S6e